MKIKLEMEMEVDDYFMEENDITDKDLKEELTERLFDVCENWVINGDKPVLDFETEEE